MIVVSGSIAWKAEAATVGALPPLTKTYAAIERVDCFLSPCSQPYNHPYDRGYNGYAYRPYGYYGYGYPAYRSYGYGYRPYGYGYGRRY